MLLLLSVAFLTTQSATGPYLRKVIGLIDRFFKLNKIVCDFVEGKISPTSTSRSVEIKFTESPFKQHFLFIVTGIFFSCPAKIRTVFPIRARPRKFWYLISGTSSPNIL